MKALFALIFVSLFGATLWGQERFFLGERSSQSSSRTEAGFTPCANCQGFLALNDDETRQLDRLFATTTTTDPTAVATEKKAEVYGPPAPATIEEERRVTRTEQDREATQFRLHSTEETEKTMFPRNPKFQLIVQGDHSEESMILLGLSRGTETYDPKSVDGHKKGRKVLGVRWRQKF